MKKAYIIVLLFLLTLQIIKAQENEKQWLSDYIEEIAENSENEQAALNLKEELEYLVNNPLDLNTVTEDELRIFPFLSDFQVRSIIKYRRAQGRFLSVYELQYVYGFNQITAKRLSPFVTVVVTNHKYKPNIKREFLGGKNTLFLRTEFTTQKQEGYLPISDSLLEQKPNSRYLGSKYKIYARYSYQYNQSVRYGFTLEKDPGEEFFKGSQKRGFDFNSFHLQIKDKKHLENLVIGDYSGFFGQGLVMYSGFGSGKSAYPLLIRKKVSGLRKYSSVNENLFLRGAGATIKYKGIAFTPFFSYKKSDANLATIDTLNDAEVLEATSIQNTGLHATPSQIEDKNSLGILLSGLNINYRIKELNIGATYLFTYFENDLASGNKRYDLYKFSGKELHNASIDYYYLFKQHIRFFGEEAYSSNGGVALLNSVMAKLAPQVDIAILHRYYSPQYYSYMAGGFGEASYNSNENGLYFGTEIYPYKFWKLSAYADLYSFPWLRSGIYAPSSGVDYFVQLDKHVARDFDVYFRYKTETKGKNLSDETLYRIEAQNKKSLRIHGAYKVSNELYLKTRAEFSYFKQEGTPLEKGYLLYQDVKYKPQNLPFDCSIRFALFNTTYNTRIYAYENDILYAFSIPAYFYKGTRFYVNLKYKITKNIDLWLRWSQFYYPYRTEIGSGLNKIEGNAKSQVKIQLRVKF